MKAQMHTVDSGKVPKPIRPDTLVRVTWRIRFYSGQHCSRWKPRQRARFLRLAHGTFTDDVLTAFSAPKILPKMCPSAQLSFYSNEAESILLPGTQLKACLPKS